MLSTHNTCFFSTDELYSLHLHHSNTPSEDQLSWHWKKWVQPVLVSLISHVFMLQFFFFFLTMLGILYITFTVSVFEFGHHSVTFNFNRRMNEDFWMKKKEAKIKCSKQCRDDRSFCYLGKENPAHCCLPSAAALHRDIVLWLFKWFFSVMESIS